MNQAAASKVALFGGADFAWNDLAYEPDRTWRAAAAYLCGGRPETVEALLAFFDVEHLAPTFGAQPWQVQAPVLAGRLARFRTGWEAAAGTGAEVDARTAAIAELRPYAELLAATPGRIRSGVTDPGFVADSERWLDALALWGTAFTLTLDALSARVAGDPAGAERLFAEAAARIRAAGLIETVPGETRPQGVVRVADGVLDVFLAGAEALE
jgi:hyaluronoglucosaminidase